MVNATSTTWRIIGASVRGAAHIRQNHPNQDAIDWFPDQEGDFASALPDQDAAFHILAVSDGHGSAKSFRSETGAALAVQTAMKTLFDFLEPQAGAENLTRLKRMAEEQLPKTLVRHWQALINADIAARPFSDDELRLLPPNNPLLAYGATVLAVAVTPSFALYLQLGDGDILTVLDDGTVERPLPKDERLFANETTSLCGKDAWRDMRVRFQTLGESVPALMFAATDGYANSFRDDAGFLKIGADLLDILSAEGIGYINAHLEEWLTEASHSGSGDDISVGLLCRLRD